MKKAITLLSVMMMGTACMAPMEDGSENDDAAIDEDAVGETSQGISAARPIGGVVASWRDGEKCTVNDEGTTRKGTWSGDFCCYDTSRGTEMCLNCFFYTCEDGWNDVGGGGFGGPPIIQTPY